MLLILLLHSRDNEHHAEQNKMTVLVLQTHFILPLSTDYVKSIPTRTSVYQSSLIEFHKYLSSLIYHNKIKHVAL